jgi:hypothetical protein
VVHPAAAAHGAPPLKPADLPQPRPGRAGRAVRAAAEAEAELLAAYLGAELAVRWATLS